jgi:hypothetical protein
MSGFERADVIKEHERLRALPHQDYGTWQLTSLLGYALHPQLREFMHFTGAEEQVFGGDEMKKCKDLVVALEQQIFGPPKPGFIPSYSSGSHKGLSREASIDWPGPLFYQCNSLLYAAQHGLPLLNANPALPVPSLGPEVDPRHNAKMLAAVMAMQCASLVLPEMGQLQPHQLLEARAELAGHVHPFRLALLKMAGKLSAAIESDASSQDIANAAKFLVQTDVYPTLAELEAELKKPRKGWKDRSWDLIKKTPELAAAYGTWNLTVAIPKTLEALGDWLIAGSNAKAPRSELYYLLKLKDVGK